MKSLFTFTVLLASFLSVTEAKQKTVGRVARAAWTLNEPTLNINERGKVHVVFQGPTNLRWVKFFMSVNEEFSKPRQAQYSFRLKCNNAKECKRAGGPVIQDGDVIHYGMIARIRGESSRQKFFGSTWIPFPLSSTTTLPSSDCSELTGALPDGCVEYSYPEVSGFPATASGRKNPERGLYKYTESIASDWTPVSSEPLDDWVNEGYTLIYRIYVLDDFVNADISDEILGKINEDFETIKNAGIKVILRFSYTIDINNINDAPPAQLEKHIQQLTPILEENVGVIALMHAGFIGVWGEWYYTANYGNEDDITPEDYEKRKEVVFNLLDALPPSRKIELRYPDMKRKILDRTSPVTSAEAHTDAAVARIGHHNDCFLASDTDYGTYLNKEEEYPYLQEENLYVSQGGESCKLNPPRSDCPTALKELSELHYTYFNSYYHPDVKESWIEQGCFDEIDNSLGYRLVGMFSRMPSVVTAGNNVGLGVRVKNMGWAAPINFRSAKVVMINQETGEEHQCPLDNDLDLRKVIPGEYDLDLTLSVPPSAATGEYKVLLKFPDGDESLMDIDAYNIVMENMEYESDLNRRLNYLGVITVA